MTTQKHQSQNILAFREWSSQISQMQRLPAVTGIIYIRITEYIHVSPLKFQNMHEDIPLKMRNMEMKLIPSQIQIMHKGMALK